MDDWSLLPSRNAASEPAPNPQSPMTTTTLPARLTRPRQAPPAGADHPRPHTTTLDPAGLARQPRNQSGAKPRNPNHPSHHRAPDTRARTRTQTSHHDRLDIHRPFMDDTGGLEAQTRPCCSLLEEREPAERASRNLCRRLSVS